MFMLLIVRHDATDNRRHLSSSSKHRHQGQTTLVGKFDKGVEVTPDSRALPQADGEPA
jgi:hypothetical protein